MCWNRSKIAKKQPKRPGKLWQATNLAGNTSKTFPWTPGGLLNPALVARLRQKPSKLTKIAEKHRFSAIESCAFTWKSGFFSFLRVQKHPKSNAKHFWNHSPFSWLSEKAKNHDSGNLDLRNAYVRVKPWILPLWDPVPRLSKGPTNHQETCLGVLGGPQPMFTHLFLTMSHFGQNCRWLL